MPIYEYHCSRCKEDFECLVIGQEPPRCPICNCEKVTRLMSPCGFVSKSSGGKTVKASAANTMCGGCTATSCSTCGA